MPPPPVVLIVMDDVALRADVFNAVASVGLAPLVTSDARSAFVSLAVRATDDVAALVFDATTVQADAVDWIRARRADGRLPGAPLIVFGRESYVHRAAPITNLWDTVVYVEGTPSLIAAVMRAGRAPTAPARIPRGSDRVDTAKDPLDLHVYVKSKLVQYLGEGRAATALQAMTADLTGRRIVTTKDLYQAAKRLSQLGELEASVAILLSGQAALLDSDRTLRS